MQLNIVVLSGSSRAQERYIGRGFFWVCHKTKNLNSEKTMGYGSYAKIDCNGVGAYFELLFFMHQHPEYHLYIWFSSRPPAWINSQTPKVTKSASPYKLHKRACAIRCTSTIRREGGRSTIYG